MDGDWTKVERYESSYGTVTKADTGDWIARVNVVRNGVRQLGRLPELFMCAEVAMGEVERRWKGENGK